MNNQRKHQPKFRPSLTIADMIDCINALQAFNPSAHSLNIFRQQVAKIAVTNPELMPSRIANNLNTLAHAGDTQGILNTLAAEPTTSNEDPNVEVGYPDNVLPEAVRSLKESLYIQLMRTGKLSANDSDYKIRVGIDTYIINNKEQYLEQLNLTDELLTTYCPLAGKPEIEL